MKNPSLRFRLLRSAIALAIVAGSSFAAAPLGASAASHSAYAASRLQTANKVTSIRHAPAAASASRGGRLRSTGISTSPASGQSAGERAAGSQLINAFNGVSSKDSEITNFGARFEPPDQGLCAGNGFVIEPVNSAYTIYRTDGTPIAGPFNVNDLFHRDGLAFTSDPRCYYDPSTNTWFATILFISTDANGNFTNQGTIDISVNTSGDPTTPWTTYSIDTSDAANTANGCPCFGDQPRLGIDNFNLYLSTDEFSILGPNFNGAQLYAVAKSDLVNLRSSIRFVQFSDPHINGNSVISVQPATTNSPADAEYWLSDMDVNFDGAVHNQIAVWAMTHRDIANGETPVLSNTVIGSEGFSVPPNAPQKGSRTLITTNDDRMQQTQFVNGTIWGELSTALQVGSNRSANVAAAWFNVHPTLSGDVIGSAAMTGQGYVALSGNDVLFPALQADQAGNAAMVFTVTGNGRYPSAAFATKSARQSNFGPISITAEGTSSYVPKPGVPGRWGDYSYASLDLGDGTMWLATEYVPPITSQTSNGQRNWGTEVIHVRLGG